MKHSRYLRASLEDVGLVEAPAVVEEPTAEDVIVTEEPTVAEAEVELVEAAQEVEESATAVDQLEKASESLESIAITMEEILEESETSVLEPQAVVLIENQVTDIADDLGVAESELIENGNDGDDDEEATIIPSTESFAADRRVASLEAFEGVKQFLSRVWLAIRSACAKAWEAVTNFFAKLWNANERLTKRIAGLRKAAGEIGAKKPKGTIKFLNPARLVYKGEFTPSAVASGLNATADVGHGVATFIGGLKGIFASINKLADDVIVAATKTNSSAGSAAAVAEEFAKNPESMKEFLATVDKSVEETLKGLEHISAESAKEASDAMSGDIALNFVKETDTISGKTREFWSGGVGLKYPEKAFEQKESEIAPLTKNQIERVLAASEKINKNIIALKPIVKSANEAAAGFRKHYDEVIKKAESLKAFEKVSTRAKIQFAMRLGAKPWTRAATLYSSHAFSSTRAALVFAERSIAAHKAD